MKRKTAVFALLVAVLGVIFLVLRRPPPAPPVVLHPTVQQAARVQSHLNALQQELEPEPQTPVPPGQTQTPRPTPSKRRTLRLSEEDLNVFLAGNQDAHKMLAARGVKAVQIILAKPANLTILAAVVLKGHTQNVQIDGGLAPDPKLGLRYTATQAQVGRLPLPPAVVTSQANALAARFASKLHGRLPLIIQTVQVQGKELILTGVLVKRTPSARNPLGLPAEAFPQSASPAHH